MELPGTIGVAIILVNSGVCLAYAGNNTVGGFSQSANETTGILRSKMRLVGPMANRTPVESDELEDVVLTYRKQYHMLRLLRVEGEEVFLYVVLERPYANLAMARHKVCEFEKQLFTDPVRVRLMHMRLQKENRAMEQKNNRSLEEARNASSGDSEDELPAYLCEDSVRRMLGLSSANAN
ncbi:MAG: hypothetical protein V4671_03510 [Armatimonadota bacterium]